MVGEGIEWLLTAPQRAKTRQATVDLLQAENARLRELLTQVAAENDQLRADRQFYYAAYTEAMAGQQAARRENGHG
jgi:hypothetical protein